MRRSVSHRSYCPRTILWVAGVAGVLGCGSDQLVRPSAEPSLLVAPLAPSNTEAVALAPDTIRVQWTDRSTNESGFEIYRSTTGPTGSFSLRAQRPANFPRFRDAQVASGKSYCYKVRAFRTQAGTTSYSAFSNTACATTPGSPVPAAPSDAAAKPVSSTAVAVTWTDRSSNEDGFRIRRSLDAGATWTVVGRVGPNITTFQDNGRTSEQAVCYRVVAFNVHGTSVSNSDCTTPPAAPTSLTGGARAQGGINLTWADNSSVEDGYEVQRSADGTTFSTIAGLPANTTSYGDAEASGNTTYWYRVTAKKDAGFSTFSNVASAQGTAPPARTQIAHARAVDGNLEIYLMNDDGTGALRLTTNSAVDKEPTYSPDRQSIAFTSDRDGASEIYIVKVDGSSVTRLTTGGGSQPSWSPDGSRIAFVRGLDIYSMKADGSDIQQLTSVGSSTSKADFPAWSPDGNKIAFMYSRCGPYSCDLGDIYVVNADGSGSGLIGLTTGGLDAHPAWSPDGAKLAFSRQTHCGFDFCFRDLFVMNADGSSETQLTQAFWEAWTDPSWSLDGGRLAVAMENCNVDWPCPTSIMIIQANGTIVAGLAEGFTPAWRQ